MIVFDTEDNSKELLDSGQSGFLKQVTQIAAICSNGKRYHESGKNCDPRKFVKWCHEMGHEAVWAFNTQYDIGNLCNSSNGYRLWDFDITMVKGRFIKGTLEGLKFCDVHNLSGAGSSVRSLGLAVGLPKFGAQYSKKEMATFTAARKREFYDFFGMSEREYWFAMSLPDHDRNLLFEKKEAVKWNNRHYVFRDCEIPMAWLKLVLEKCELLNMDNLPLTLGGLCTRAFTALGNSNWYEASICDCEDSCDCQTTAKALTGARVELFSGGGYGRIAYTDVNSLYPWAMTQPFPTTIEELPLDLKGHGIARASVTVPVCRVAPLPFKDGEGRLIFPVGKFTGIWTLHELRNATRHGTVIRKIHWCLGSHDAVPYYRDYILQMYRNRQSARSPAENLFWKLLMNNLYGRLAIGGVISRSLNLTEENFTKGIPYGRKVLMDTQMPLPAFSNYLHAAHVLSYGRVRLHEYLCRVPADDLIYCDTDSMIFFCRGKLPFPCNSNLGEMKLETMGVRCIPYLPKTYIFDEKYKAKGVSKDKAKEFILHGSTEYDLPFKLREAIRFYEDDNSHKLSVWRRVEKIRAAVYDRKKINGKYFLPKTVNYD